MTERPLALVALTRRGAALAQTIAVAIGSGEVHGFAKRVDDADLTFSDPTAHIAGLFREGRPIIGICSAGILIRALGPHLGKKTQDPAVICVAEDGSAVIPLLGGHRGANKLAQQIGDALGVRPALTTASDLSLGFALDDPPEGWRVGNPEAAKGVAAELLSGAPVRVVNEVPDTVDTSWLKIPQGEGGDTTIRLTERTVAADESALCLHPGTLALGVGCERGVPGDDLSRLADDMITASGFSPDALACIATIDIKENEPAIRDLVQRLDKPLVLFSPERLEQETPRLAKPSDYVYRTVGCHGVAEGAALAAAGAEAALAVEKVAGDRATLALARAPSIIEPYADGRPPGWLAVVGIGPGDSGWRAPEAAEAIEAASDLVGYGLYLDLLGGLAANKVRHDYPLGQEQKRVEAALALAAQGKRVCLVSSGDAGIYGMASLVFEVLEETTADAWRRLDIRVVPGISAMQAAAARAGAPLGHDFCAISLSDLMTPWDAIERRLRAAADGDFVVILYNPVSKRRRQGLPRAREILLGSRSGTTPVVVARNLGRPGEEVRHITLAELEIDQADMLSLVVIGNSETRRVANAQGGYWTYTPRGYGAARAKVAS